VTRVASIRRLVRYDRRAFDSFERSARRLGWARASRDREIGHGSIKNTLVHILNVHEAWLVAAAQDRWDEVRACAGRRPEAVRSFRDLARYRERVWGAIDPLVAGLTERALARRVAVPWIVGRYTLEDGFQQASFEQAHHLGEVIAAYWQMDRTPPQMMWIPLLTGVRVPVA
jgi:uncharacterized damage-inducible protein DinB